MSSVDTRKKQLKKVAFCSEDELSEIFACPRLDKLLIGGFVDEESQTVTLWRANFDTVTVPFSEFSPSGDGIVPDFSQFAIIDCGQTIQFGEYEAATDSILTI